MYKRQAVGCARERALERELGVSLDFFERFDETPVAAASLAQVYRATLPGGHDVAIKLQRPGLA